MKPRWQRTAKREAHTVDVTAFLSLMVILIPFLLMTAVFSRTTIVEIQPTIDAGEQAAMPDPLQLQITVRQAVIEVRHLDQLGRLQTTRINRSADDEPLASLATLAHDIKARFPDSLEAIVLVEPQVSYEVLVQVLDVLRIRFQPDGDGVEAAELFPLIALGPVAAAEPAGRRTP